MYNTYDNSDKVIYIPINAIKPNPYKMRKFYDITSVSALADSIKTIGLIQPVIVRNITPNSYELVSGERRLHASEIAGFNKIKAIILNISDDQSAIFSLTENIQRKNISFFDKSEAFYRLIFEHNVNKELLSKQTGVSESDISLFLKFSKLSQAVKAIIVENGLSEQFGLLIADIPSESDKLFLLRKAVELKLSILDFEKYIFSFLNNKNVSVIPERRKKIKCSGIGSFDIVFNTFNKAIKLVEDAGIKLRATRTEHKRYYEYNLKIIK